MTNRGLAALAAILTALVVLFLACGPHETSSFCEGNACGPDGSSASDSPGSFGSDHGAPQSLTITPASSTLAVTDLSNPPSTSLTAQITFTDGTSAAASASWSLDRLDIASIGAGTGQLVPTTTAFGKVTVTAQAQGLSATATVTVTLQATVNSENVPSSDAAKLAAATMADPAVTVLAYPYDNTVFPKGLVPPEMMWNLGSPADEYEVHLVAPNLDLAVLTTADPPSRFTLPQALWNIFVESAAGSDATVELRRLSSGSAYLSVTQTWHIADANLRGLVYFWNISQGELLKADSDYRPGVAGPEPRLERFHLRHQSLRLRQSAPTQLRPAGHPAVGGQRPRQPLHCLPLRLQGWVDAGGSLLHRRLVGAARLIDLGDHADQRHRRLHSHRHADRHRARRPLAVMNTASKGMQLIDATTGAAIASALDALTDVCDPTFSPDGTLFALAANCTGGTNFALEFSQSDLVIYDFAEATRTFTNPRTILTSGAAGQSAFAFPSFSPDSKWLFFQGGNYSRAKYGTNQHGSDDPLRRLRAGRVQAAVPRQDQRRGVVAPDNLHLNYAPTVNPIPAGGYTWIVFTSPRDYGNRMVSPSSPPRWTRPTPTTSSSGSPPSTRTSARSTPATPPSGCPVRTPPRPTCSATGRWRPASPAPPTAGRVTCDAGFECCSGFCRNEGQGFVCTESPGGCSQLGEKCTMSSDCCGAGPSLGCVAGICQTIVQ